MNHAAKIGLVAVVAMALGFGCSTPNVPVYQGKAYQGKIQEIPGRVSCIRYDEGGEGIAYHDRDATNQAAVCCGSTFRVNEGVDVGVMAHHHKSLGAPLDPDANYVGWIQEGEWIKYTLNVKRKGVYQLNAHMSSANTNCQIRFTINDQDFDPISFSRATGDVHMWDVYTNLAEFKLQKGVQVLVLRFSKGQKGDQNFEYFDFVRKP